MIDRPLAAVVLAAGKGKRMRASVPKVLLRACGRTLVEHVLEALRPLGAAPIAVVHGHGGDAVPRSLAGRDLVFVHQAEQLGTGHAVSCALPHFEGLRGDVLVVCGDTPLLTSEVLSGLVDDHLSADRALTVLSAELEDPGSLGRVLRGPDGGLVAIREAADATPDERAVREINTGVMVIGAEHLPGALARLESDNAQGEFYLTDVPGLLLSDGLSVEAHRTEDAAASLGVNDPLELARATGLLRGRNLAALLDAGVRVEDPSTTIVDADVEVGEGAVLRPHVFLGCGVRIGRDCVVGPHAGLREGTVVGDGAVLGPGTQTEGVEGRVEIGKGARIGAGTILVAPVIVAAGAVVAPNQIVSRGGDTPVGDGDHA